jgi:hypothetical protein
VPHWGPRRAQIWKWPAEHVVEPVQLREVGGRQRADLAEVRVVAAQVGEVEAVDQRAEVASGGGRSVDRRGPG